MLGSQSVSGGFNYFGSYAGIVCIGKAGDPGWSAQLQALWNGDTLIWSGGIDSSSADADGKVTLTTSIGLIDFYFGSNTQNASAVLGALTVDYGAGPVPALIPAYRNVCYAVCRDVAFGSQVAPPTILADIAFRRDVLTLSSHMAGGDINVPECIYWLLTNTFDGFGVDPAHIDQTSFETAGDITSTEGLRASPQIDSSTGARDLFAQLMTYIDARLVFENGKLTLKLIRNEDTTSIPSLNEGELLDEIEPEDEQFDATWNRTFVSFSQRPATDDNPNWDDTSEQYDDPANLAIVEMNVPKTFNFPWVTSRDVAKIIARRIGIRGGLPAKTWTMTLKPKWRTLRACDLIKLSYSRFGTANPVSNRVLRITEIRRGPPSDRSVQVTAIEERIPDASHLYTPTDTVPVPESTDPVSTTPRLSWLPPDLRAGTSGGFMVAMNRPDASTVSSSIWWTFDPLVAEYQRQPVSAGFPAAGTLISWHKIRSGNWLFRVQMDSTQDLTWLQALVAETPGVLAGVGERLYRSVGTPKNEHQAMALWLSKVTSGRFVLLGSNVVDIELTGAHFGTDDLALEGVSSDGKVPAIHVYFGRQEDFLIYPSNYIVFAADAPNGPSDTGFVRYVKVTIRNHTREQTLSDVTAVTYARHDTTMCPDGTYSTDWGARTPTTYELFDQSVFAALPSTLTDIDAALMAMLDGTATADQQLLADDINQVLGSMLTDGHQYYS